MDVVELRVALTEADIARVTVMADEQGVTKTQVLRDAIVMKEFIDRKISEGAELVLKWDDHHYQKVSFTVPTSPS